MVKTIKKVFKVAVTGGAGSGKSSVCNRLKELGITIISSDTLAREAVAPGSTAHKKILNYFGEKVVLSDGKLNRQMLRRIIVNDGVARRSLEQFIHPEITKLMQRKMAQAEKNGDRVVAVEIPLLFELGIEKQFDIVVIVSADPKLRVKRLMDRDNVFREDAEELLNVQMPDQEKVKRGGFVLSNNGSTEQLISSVDRFYEKYLKNTEKGSKVLDSQDTMF
ncbi:MAG: dephospho-CoA kinase [Deltaproteobacteria bacterium]|nr:dephospho-CoA kinase [Deltaproteobacteria bacterium]MBW2638879.1 dephospho-CoA kinase [Deltaproteobacteria bacterium]MBW2681022.1 dephospho-CoA kinase [Deltaproteobacteria bacterium]